MQWGKGLQSDRTLKFSYWISLILHGQPYQAFKISTLKLFLGGSVCWRAGFLHFYRLSQQKMKAGAVVSPLLTQTLTQVSRESLQNRELMQSWTYLGLDKKNMRIIQNWKSVIQGGTWRLSVYSGWPGESWEVSWPSTARSWENIFWQKASSSMEQT